MGSAATAGEWTLPRIYKVMIASEDRRRPCRRSTAVDIVMVGSIVQNDCEAKATFFMAGAPSCQKLESTKMSQLKEPQRNCPSHFNEAEKKAEEEVDDQSAPQ